MIRIGDRIADRYRITSRIGMGGMAEVFEANDLVLKRTVAIKIMREDLLKDHENVVRFENEVKACASMNHPNIIQVFDQGVLDSRPWIAYEYIKGQTLFEKLEFLTQLPAFEACEIMCQLLDAVSYIHQHGIIHRDIKPQNIFYLPNGTIKLSDFGIAVDTNINDTKSDEGIMGSVFYLAPEVCSGKPATVQSDIYSCGVTFFQLVTGRLPYETGHAIDIAIAHIKKPFPSVTKYNPDISKEIDKIIQKACRKNAKDRYRSASAMLNAIKLSMKNNDNFKEKKNIIKKIFGFK